MNFNLDSPKQTQDSSPLVTEESVLHVDKGLPVQSLLTGFLQHGGFYSLLDDEAMNARFTRLAHSHPNIASRLRSFFGNKMKETAKLFFYHLVNDKPYTIHSSLISHITFPHEGRTYSEPGTNNDNPAIPAFMTFVGQFLDHDLTLNTMNLFDDQDGNGVINDASPLIDLDSVYGRESDLEHGSMDDIFNNDGTFKLRRLGPNAYDLTRDAANKAFIYDARNDENQIISQIHILLMRLHNKLVSMLPPPANPAHIRSRNQIINIVRREVQYTWQSFVLNEYLPTVVNAVTLNEVMTEIVKPGFGNLKQKPIPATTDGIVSMPHEFSIGFRMGHSQLRDAYHLNPLFNPIPLFDNRSAQPNDLRGSTPLIPEHVIDWSFFAQPAILSNKIDGKVTSKVFDLPESAIPDKVKQVGNLAQRNLIRSSQIALASGEDVALFYGVTPILTPAQVEPDAELQKLFKFDNDGKYDDTNPFRTPLWYYVIKEAEVLNGGGQLGPLGGHIVAEVLAGGVYYNKKAFVYHAEWNSQITGNRAVHFTDIVNFVHEV